MARSHLLVTQELLFFGATQEERERRGEDTEEPGREKEEGEE